MLCGKPHMVGGSQPWPNHLPDPAQSGQDSLAATSYFFRFRVVLGAESRLEFVSESDCFSFESACQPSYPSYILGF